ncbi:hypothetical protein [Nakamurella sp.]|uniref:hypothetical protein n=1 Tax=Nakamurella sp. TaxID=1869182 RepID=UPI0037831CF9
MADSRIAVLFVHGVGIREPDYARTAIAQLRRQFRAATGYPDADDDLIIESAYWAPAVVEREDRLERRVVPGFAAGWFGAMNKLTQKVATGSTLALVPLALSGLVRHVPGIPRIHWPTLRWAVTNFVGDVVSYQVSPHSREVYDAVHGRVREALDRLAEQAPDAPLFVVAHSLGSVIAADHFYDLSKGRRQAATALAGGRTLTGFYTLGSPIALWTQRDGDFATPLQIPARVSADPVLAAAAEWINFYDADDVLAFPLKGLSDEWDRAVDEDRSVSVGALIIGMSPVSHVAYWNDAAVIRPIANSIAWLWNARRDGAGRPAR